EPAPRPANSPPRALIAFHDDAAAVGLGFTYHSGESPQHQVPETIGGGVAVLDYDGDGWLDVYLVQGGVFPPKVEALPLPDGRGSVRAPTEPRPSGRGRGLPGPEAGDRLFRNRRDGTFEDVT